jgi:hypothetical protein
MVTTSSAGEARTAYAGRTATHITTALRCDAVAVLRYGPTDLRAVPPGNDRCTAELRGWNGRRGGERCRGRGLAAAVHVANLRRSADRIAKRDTAPALAVEPGRADRRTSGRARRAVVRGRCARSRLAPQRQGRRDVCDVLVDRLRKAVDGVAARRAGLAAKLVEAIAALAFQTARAGRGEIDEGTGRCPRNDLNHTTEGARGSSHAQHGDLRISARSHHGEQSRQPQQPPHASSLHRDERRSAAQAVLDRALLAGR